MKYFNLIIIGFCSLLIMSSCKKEKLKDYTTTIRVINKTNKIIDSLEISTFEKKITKFETINLNDTTSKITLNNLNKEVIFEVYINNKKFSAISQLSSTVDPSSRPDIFFKGCFDFYLLDLDTIRSKILIAYYRDSDCFYSY